MAEKSWGDDEAVVQFFLSNDESAMSIITNSQVPEKVRVETIKDIIRKQSKTMSDQEIDRLAKLAAPRLVRK